MSASLLFYDLETSGISPREQRIMQFAAQRTDMNLEPIGETFNIVIKLTDDILPDPDAILVTGITPQQTLTEGITEAEFLKIFHKDVAIPGTIFVGYNTVRFDDEFMRYLHYRNFYDAYEWHWQDGKSRWDLLDVVRITRALRPDGIKWPFGPDGKASNRLELLTSINGLDHQNAHDALNDVLATIALAWLIREKQPRLFEYLLKMRDKRAVEELVTSGEPFVYASGKYPSETEKTTVTLFLCENPKTGALVYDLRHDPSVWLDKTPEELAEAWKWKRDSTEPRLPVKTLQYNRCPAVAPLTVLDDASKERIKLNMDAVAANAKILRDNPDFCHKVQQAAQILNKQQQTAWLSAEQFVDSQLYDGFIGGQDKTKMRAVSAASADEIADLQLEFADDRLNKLLPLYKMRNFPESSIDDEREAWESFRSSKLLGTGAGSRAEKFFKRLSELADQPGITENQCFLLEELQLYGQSILPEPN
jgi:exodeoxyribonuclease-1